VAKDLIANDETEISEVVRRRLFEDIGKESVRKAVAREYADWCFERRAQLPPEWTAVDTSVTEAKAKDFLRKRFEACYPFHPATLSVFQWKWQALPQYQQTRGTLAMFAQWVSWVFRKHFEGARREPLVTIGSAPLYVSEFQAVVIGQLGEARLVAAIEADIVGQLSHAKTLDADTRGSLKDIHQRVAAAIFFESSGGQRDRVAHLPEIRFALGEPAIDTTSIDNAAHVLESKAFYLHRFGTDGFKFGYKPTLKKVVNDRRASLGEDEVTTAVRNLVKKEFEKGATLPLIPFPEESSAVQDTPRLTLALMDPDTEWNEENGLRAKLGDWCRNRGSSPRMYPGSLVWCVRKPGRGLREKVELWLAWKRVSEEMASGALVGDFEAADRQRVAANLKEAEEAARDEVWGSYRYAFLLDSKAEDGIKLLDLGAGHASAAESLTGRVITALKSEGLLNESVGAGYIDRNWPTSLKDSGAWSLIGLRQSFLNGSLTRLIDPDRVLKTRIPEYVERGDFGLASGSQADGRYSKVWFRESISPDEVSFEKDVFLLLKDRAEKLKSGVTTTLAPAPETTTEEAPVEPATEAPPAPGVTAKTTTQLQIIGTIPPEIWNRFGSRILPKVRNVQELSIGITITVSGSAEEIVRLQAELKQALSDLGLEGQVEIR